MSILARQRCLHHASREAVARCPECGHMFCRECVTEHQDRVICASCLKKLTAKKLARRSWMLPAWQAGQTLCALLVAWFVFFTVARALLAIPTDFHDGAVWKRAREAVR